MIDAYLGYGWWVFPLKPASKLPLTVHGVHDSACDKHTISEWRSRWPECGWGIDAGKSGLLIVDLDGDEGITAWQHLAAERGAPHTLTSRTGSGGYHLVYTDPDGRGRNSAGLLAPHVDTRGRGGYIAAPPSIHPNGTPYRWARKMKPVPAPEWVFVALAPPDIPRTRAPVAAFDVGETTYGRKTLDGILNRLTAATDGDRHNLNYWAGVRAGQLYAAGHISMSALGHVIDTARSVRRDQARAERDATEGWEWGVEHPGDYEPARPIPAALVPPRLATPRLEAPR